MLSTKLKAMSTSPATEKSPLERHLYAIHLDGSGMEQVTQQPEHP